MKELIFSLISPTLLSFLLILIFDSMEEQEEEIIQNLFKSAPTATEITSHRKPPPNCLFTSSSPPNRTCQNLWTFYAGSTRPSFRRGYFFSRSHQTLFKDNDIKVSNRCRASVTDIIFYNRQDIAFAPYGEYWRQIRKLCILELFSKKRVQSFRSIREQEVSNFIQSVNSKVGSVVNFSEMVFSLTHSIVSRTIIGRKNEHQEAMLRIMGPISRVVAGFTVLDMFPSRGFIHVITGMKSRLLKLHKEADQLLEDIIKEHKAELKTEANNKNLLNVLLNLQANPDSFLTTDGIKAIILEIFIAASESSAIVLEWVMSELIKNQSVMKKAQAEVRKVRVENGNKLDESVIHELKFFKAIIKETLRLHPPVPLIPRLVGEKCEINGYNINAETEVLVNVWAIGRDANHWIEPEKFYPERFVDNEVDYKGFNFESIPFGAGRRICPAIESGIANVELPLAKLLCAFDWKLPSQIKPENLDMSETFALGIKRKNPLYLIPVASP